MAKKLTKAKKQRDRAARSGPKRTGRMVATGPKKAGPARAEEARRQANTDIKFPATGLTAHFSLGIRGTNDPMEVIPEMPVRKAASPGRRKLAAPNSTTGWAGTPPQRWVPSEMPAARDRWNREVDVRSKASRRK